MFLKTKKKYLVIEYLYKNGSKELALYNVWIIDSENNLWVHYYFEACVKKKPYKIYS